MGKTGVKLSFSARYFFFVLGPANSSQHELTHLNWGSSVHRQKRAFKVLVWLMISNGNIVENIYLSSFFPIKLTEINFNKRNSFTVTCILLWLQMLHLDHALTVSIFCQVISKGLLDGVFDCVNICVCRHAIIPLSVFLLPARSETLSA